MKIQIVGDTHCEDTWRELVDDSADRIVFLGDYVDSGFHTDIQMVRALIDIIEFKQGDPDRVALLLGNHDCHYIFPSFPPAGGYRPGMRHEIKGLFESHLKLFRFTETAGDHLFTHAGVTADWWSMFTKATHGGATPDDIDGPGFAELPEVFYCSPYRGGMALRGGPLWCDRKEMKKFGPLPGWHQHVGHSRTKKKVKLKVDDSTSVSYYNYPFEKGITTIDI